MTAHIQNDHEEHHSKRLRTDNVHSTFAAPSNTGSLFPSPSAFVGFKWLWINVLSLSYILSLGLSGLTKLRINPYVLCPHTVNSMPLFHCVFHVVCHEIMLQPFDIFIPVLVRVGIEFVNIPEQSSHIKLYSAVQCQVPYNPTIPSSSPPLCSCKYKIVGTTVEEILSFNGGQQRHTKRHAHVCELKYNWNDNSVIIISL